MSEEPWDDTITTASAIVEVDTDKLLKWISSHHVAVALLIPSGITEPFVNDPTFVVWIDGQRHEMFAEVKIGTTGLVESVVLGDYVRNEHKETVNHMYVLVVFDSGLPFVVQRIALGMADEDAIDPAYFVGWDARVIVALTT